MKDNQSIDSFNPSENNIANNLFGLPFSLEEAGLVVIPVPCDITASYGKGTASAPEEILKASSQIDLFDPFYKAGWKMGIAMEGIPENFIKINDKYNQLIRDCFEKPIKAKNSHIKEINMACEELTEHIYEKALAYINKGKIVSVLGGDHSSALGLIKAVSVNDKIGILQIDAHADLRKAYQGFEYSHASVMYNALRFKGVEKIVSVGLRDFCEEEFNVINNEKGRVVTFLDRDSKQRMFEGENWSVIVQEIIATLPQKVYVSFDIDGLTPVNCLNTGTPVPGGLEYSEACYLIEKLAESDREIVGFDLCETGADKHDIIIAIRLLYKLILASLKTQKR